VVGVDLHGTILTWNAGAERLYGYTGEEAVGRSLFSLVLEEQRDTLQAALEQTSRGERVDRCDVTVRRSAGGGEHVSLTLSPVVGSTGQVRGAFAVAADPARSASERTFRSGEARWRAVVESAVDGIIVINARGIIEAFNPAAERLFGYSEGEMLGKNVSVLMPAPYHDEHDGYLERYLRTGERRIIGIGREVVGRRRDGSTFPLHLSVGEATLDGERIFTGMLHDLTDRARVEAQLRDQTALARLGEMASVLAHEIKNPLAAVQGAIQVIGGRLPAASTEAAVVKEIIARLDRLNLLTEELLLFARPPVPKPSAVDIVPLVTTTAELLGRDPTLEQMSVEVVGAAAQVHGDADLLKIVFHNLLRNGADAMNGRGMIHVSVAELGQECDIAIADEGPGIPAEVRSKLFTPFFTTKARGTGLGLAIAKRIVEAHHGTIAVDCPADAGTTVSVRLPIEFPAAK
jgi:two-component system, LuxR family, sensor kinase FixL